LSLKAENYEMIGRRTHIDVQKNTRKHEGLANREGFTHGAEIMASFLCTASASALFTYYRVIMETYEQCESAKGMALTEMPLIMDTLNN